jgi:hypothetical protein
MAAIPRAKMINANHQRSGIVEKTFVRKFMKLLGRTESDAERIPRDLRAAKITKGSFQTRTLLRPEDETLHLASIDNQLNNMRDRGLSG